MRRAGCVEAVRYLLTRLDRLSEVVRTARGPVYLETVIMRATVTLTSAEALSAYARVARYSELGGGRQTVATARRHMTSGPSLSPSLRECSSPICALEAATTV